MQLNEEVELVRKVGLESPVQVFHGLEAYIVPLVRRIIEESSPIKQIINGVDVARFHEYSDRLVDEFISKRAEMGLEFKNLIRQEDKHLEIERSNPKALKETRLLPDGFKTHSYISVFGSVVTVTSLEDDNPLGVIIKNGNIAETFHSMFDSIWDISEKY